MIRRFTRFRQRFSCIEGLGIVCLCFAGLGVTPVALSAAKPQERPSAIQRANESYAAGIEALKQRDLETARARFEEAAKLLPESAEVHNSLGYVLVLSDN